ncbi:hypothetical protein OURE66S_02948 [Oligella ureolytica]
MFLQQKLHHSQRKDEGLHAAFTGIFPIESNNGYARLEFESYRLEAPVFDVKECQLRLNLWFSILRHNQPSDYDR